MSAGPRAGLLLKTKKEGGSVTLAEPSLTETDAERIANGHFAIFNVWRHFRTRYPIAVLDPATTTPSDFHVTKYIYPQRVGEVVNGLSQSRHRWAYYSEMQHDAALMFKKFDTDAELGLAPEEDCPQHTAPISFRLSQVEDDTPAHESMECRVLVELETVPRIRA